MLSNCYAQELINFNLHHPHPKFPRVILWKAFGLERKLNFFLNCKKCNLSDDRPVLSTLCIKLINQPAPLGARALMGEGLPTFLSRVPFAFCLNSPIHYAHIFLSLKLFHPFEKTARFAQAYSCRRTGWASGETDGHQGTGAPFLHGSLMSPTIQIPILMAVSAEVHRQPSSRSAVEISARNAECKAHREASSYHVWLRRLFRFNTAIVCCQNKRTPQPVSFRRRPPTSNVGPGDG